MRDPDIRAALVERLVRRHPDPQQSRIWEEMSVGLGASRVDVGLVNGQLSGYEIKSAGDSLARLPGQIVHYGRCLDRATVVVAGHRAATITDYVPAWWGVTVAEDKGGRVVLRSQRAAGRNPELDPFFVAQLLWRDEAYEELCRVGHQAGLAKATRWQLWDRLAELPLTQLRTVVRTRLKARSCC